MNKTATTSQLNNSKTFAPRVLLLTDSDAFAGTERHIIDLAESMITRGAIVTIGCPNDSPLMRRARLSAIPTLSVPKQHFPVSMLLRLISELKSRRFDIVHAHNGVSNLIASASVFASGNGRCVSTQHFVAPARMYRKGLKAQVSRAVHSFTSRYTSKYIAVSHSVAQVCLESEICNLAKLAVVPNGTTIPQVIPISARTVRENLGIGKNQYLIVSVSRLAPEKNVDLLIQAMAHVKERQSDAVCVIAGGGDIKAALEEQIKSLRLVDSVRLLGHVEDPLSLVNAADLFVLPGGNEGFGLALLEAMMLAKPVIAANAGGPKEIVSHRVDGFLFEPNSATSLAAEILENIAEHSFSIDVGIKGQQKCLRTYIADEMGRKTLDVYAASTANSGTKQ